MDVRAPELTISPPPHVCAPSVEQMRELVEACLGRPGGTELVVELSRISWLSSREYAAVVAEEIEKFYRDPWATADANQEMPQ